MASFCSEGLTMLQIALAAAAGKFENTAQNHQYRPNNRDRECRKGAKRLEKESQPKEDNESWHGLMMRASANARPTAACFAMIRTLPANAFRFGLAAIRTGHVVLHITPPFFRIPLFNDIVALLLPAGTCYL
jgi:hypothetical protein